MPTSIGGAVGGNLKKALDFLPLGRKLVTIVCDLPLHQQGDRPHAAAGRTREKLVELFTRLEFKGWTWKKRRRAKYGEAKAEAGGKSKPRDGAAVRRPARPCAEEEPDRSAYVCITTWAQFDEWLAIINAAKLTALDTETTDLDQMQAKSGRHLLRL